MRKQSIILFLAVLFGITAGIIYYYNGFILPKVEHSVEQKVKMEYDDTVMPRTKVAVVTDPNGIAKYTVLTDDIINSRIKILDIPVKYASQSAVPDVDQLRGKITKEDLRFSEQIMLDSLSAEKKWFGEYERLKEYKVTSIVAGEVKTGNIIDIIVNYGNGDYDIVVPKVKVRKLLDESGKADSSVKTDKLPNPAVAGTKSSDGRSDEYTLIVSIDEEPYRDLELASKLGKLETRLYLDESQPASIKTFNYSSALSRLKLGGTTEKVNGTEISKSYSGSISQDAKNTAGSLEKMPIKVIN